MNRTIKNNSYRKKVISGFSLVETVIVFTVISFLTIGAIGTFHTLRNRTALEEARATIVYALEGARSRAAAGVGTTDHGVYVDDQRVVTFEGDIYVEGAGFEIVLPASVSTDQTGTEIIFNRLNATTASDVTITLTHSDGSNRTVIITATGVVQSDD